MHIGRYADGSYKRLSKLPRPSLSCYFAFVETGGDLITDASFDDYRYRVKSNTWEMLSLPSRAKLQSLVPLSGGRMWARAWLRGFRHAYLLGTNQVWQDLGKLKGVILHRAPGSAKTVHLGSSTEVTVVNVDTKSTRRWKVARYVSQVLALDADRSGRTWVAGTDGLAIVPAPGAATKVRSASTRNLSAWAGLPGHGPLTAVHVPGKGPEIISIPF